MDELNYYEVPFAFQMYGRIEVKAKNEKESVRIARKKLEKMGVQEMIDNSSYLSNSEEIDDEGIITNLGPVRDKEVNEDV